jgi:hypothetical protein
MWINTLALLKQVRKEYKPLIIKMAPNSGFAETMKVNLMNLCDVDTILCLPCVLPMLEHVNTLMKFA